MKFSKNFRTEFIHMTDRIFQIILHLNKIALKISFITFLLTTVFMVLFGTVKEDGPGSISAIFWYLLLFSMWTLFLTGPIILGVSIYRKLTNRLIWNIIKSETRLFFATFAVAILLYTIIQFRN